MKMFRRILTIVLVVFIALISAGFLLPRKVHVERRLLLNASQKGIFEQVNSLKNWEKWSPWIQSDTGMQLSFSGPESGPGAKLSWQSNNKNIGTGSVSIISSISPDSLEVIFDFADKGKSTGKFFFIKENQNTNVTLSIDSDLGMNPLSRWFGMFSDHMIGPDLEKGLLNLDQLLQDNRAVYGYEIIDFEAPAQILITVRDTATSQTVVPKLTLMYQYISLFLKSHNLSPTGNPIAVFHDYRSGNYDIEAGMPVEIVVAVPSGLNCIEKSAHRTAMLKYFGSYGMISNAYKALQSYVNNNGLQIDGPGWEEYITNPNMDIDSNNRQTNIYYPIR